jgi:ATP-dependent helicase/nuclease subunit A
LAGEADDDLAEAARARGSFVHLLLEHLPALPAADRPEAARALTAAFETADLLGNPAPLIADVMAMLESPALGALFGQGQAEVEITADLAELGGERLTGTVDRLIVANDLVTVIDYKTNRLVPATAEAVPEGILRQMGAYLAMLAQIWPGRPAQAVVLWTATGALMPLPRDLCMAALRRGARS